ncbi:hypothetical protein E2P71_05680 [Candidatus Bathyarchaeota archaeon]|nr:hypothetical protein E2P71_05680 [Candidatus Bathyarchaeota archaeon]
MNVENVGDFTAAYLSAYRRILPIDDERIPYYKVLRCVMALQEGADGQVVWTHPEIIGYLTDEIHAQSGVSVEPPSTGR